MKGPSTHGVYSTRKLNTKFLQLARQWQSNLSEMNISNFKEKMRSHRQQAALVVCKEVWFLLFATGGVWRQWPILTWLMEISVRTLELCTWKNIQLCVVLRWDSLHLLKPHHQFLYIWTSLPPRGSPGGRGQRRICLPKMGNSILLGWA